MRFFTKVSTKVLQRIVNAATKRVPSGSNTTAKGDINIPLFSAAPNRVQHSLALFSHPVDVASVIIGIGIGYGFTVAVHAIFPLLIFLGFLF